MNVAKILLIDNYDSFTYNLAQYFWELNYDLEVCRNDKITISQIKNLNPSHLVISPGPGTPDDSGISLELIAEFYDKKPILGVCLGHQCLGQFFGAKIQKAPLPRHGKTSIIEHQGEGIFKNLPNPLKVTRYHSLIVNEADLAQTPLKAIAKSLDDNLLMALKHQSYPLYGVQFHPESIMTESGHALLKNFIEQNAQ